MGRSFQCYHTRTLKDSILILASFLIHYIKLLEIGRTNKWKRRALNQTRKKKCLTSKMNLK